MLVPHFSLYEASSFIQMGLFSVSFCICWICRSRCPTCDLQPLPVKTINISHIKASRREWSASIHSHATVPTRRLSVRIATIYQTSEVCPFHQTNRTFEIGIRSTGPGLAFEEPVGSEDFILFIQIFIYFNFLIFLTDFIYLQLCILIQELYSVIVNYSTWLINRCNNYNSQPCHI